MQTDKIYVIDFGGQYAHLIAAKVRRAGVRAEIRQPEDPDDAYSDAKGIIISGSPALAAHGEDADYNKGVYDLPIPILGFCFGHQEIAKHYGGEVIHGGRQWGFSEITPTREHPLFTGLGPTETVWMSHYDSVSALGPGFEELGFTEGTTDAPDHRFAAIGNDELRRYGFQFHPEVDDTVHGDEMIANFVFEICGCEKSWDMASFLEAEIGRIRTQVGDGSVFLLASGGVDSTVAAAVIGKALGPERLHLLHVDNGMMRKGESAAVLELFEDLGLDRHLHFADASDVFLEALGQTVEPEAKRKIIGDTFIEVFDAKARELGIEEHLLGQGTIYPDTVETGGTRRADTIKTHHNRVQVIEDLIAEEDMIVTISHAGYIKRNVVTEYRAQRRGGKGKLGMGTRDEDFVKTLFTASTHDFLLFFTSAGKVHWLKVHEIPEAGRISKGKAIVNLLPLGPDEQVTATLPVRTFRDDQFVVMATKKGTIKKTELSAYGNPRQGGIIALTLDEGDKLIEVEITDGHTDILLGTKHGIVIRFKEERVRSIGRTGKGVRGITLDDTNEVIGMVTITPDSDTSILTVTEGGYGKRTQVGEYRTQGRAGRGVISVKVTEKNGYAVSFHQVKDSDEIMIMTAEGKILRTTMNDIREIGRNAQGVRIMDMEDSDRVVGVAKLAEPTEQEESGSDSNGTDPDDDPQPDPPEAA